MTLRKNFIVKEAVLEKFPLLGKKRFSTKADIQHCMLVFAALLLAGTVIWGIVRLSGNGDIEVIKQRITGEVNLSSGKFSARTVSQLNRLSWENGLEILATLDALNSSIKELQIPPNKKAIKDIETSIDNNERKLKELLNDRKIILESAGHFKTKHLYAPVYQEYLHDTMSLISSLKKGNHPQSESLTKN